MGKQVNTIFISHGGGPLPLLGEPSHAQLTQRLKELASALPHPKAILVISAHWEEEVTTISSNPQPPMLYDYQGFPAESYRLTYPAPGSPELAKTLCHRLTQAGRRARLDPLRGFDHGVFVPLMIMYPEAKIPVLQLSLTRDLDPLAHLEVGEALKGLDIDGLLVIGSGFSFHNMSAFSRPHTADVQRMNEAFEDWLHEVCASPAHSYEARKDHLAQWMGAPYSRFCHPREEHLLPLHVCVGFTQRPATAAYQVEVLRKRSSLFLWRG